MPKAKAKPKANRKPAAKARRKPAVRARKPRPAARVARPRVRARYDAAQTTTENQNHWSAADHLSANSAMSPGIRATLRSRARYEAANNGDCKGLIRTVRNDVVGTGPRLQVAIPETYTDPEFGTQMKVRPGLAALVEKKWADWCDLTGLFDKLRVMEETTGRDGECFGVTVTNAGLPADGVQLDLRLVEADQCTTPDLLLWDPLAVDGIRFDESGNPVEYHFLKRHPGDPHWHNPWDYDVLPAARVIHWFDPDRPGQARGIPSITPSLPLYAILRRYTLAALGAAETAASIAGVLETGDNGLAPDEGDAPEFESFDEVDMPRRGLLTLPAGWKASGFTAEQPVVGHREFRGEVLTEAGRAVTAPRNVSTGSSAEYNYSSARLDHLPYRQGVRITRDRMRRVVLDRLYRLWLREAVLIPGYLPVRELPPVALWSQTWHWDGFESIDPVKDAQADDIGLKNGTRTLAQVLGERGIDWEQHIAQKGREQDRLNEAGLTAVMAMAVPAAAGQTDENGEPAENASQAAASGGVQGTALNGAQITSLLLLADKVVLKQYPADAATALVQAAFPLMSKALIDRFIKGLVAAPIPETPTEAPADAEAQAAA